MPVRDTAELYGTNAGGKSKGIMQLLFLNGAFTFHGGMKETLEACP